MSLTDFPYISMGRLWISFQPRSVQLTAGMTGALSQLQAQLATTGIKLKLIKDNPTDET